jgi:hypothetical protein
LALGIAGTSLVVSLVLTGIFVAAVGQIFPGIRAQVSARLAVQGLPLLGWTILAALGYLAVAAGGSWVVVRYLEQKNTVL